MTERSERTDQQGGSASASRAADAPTGVFQPDGSHETTHLERPAAASQGSASPASASPGSASPGSGAPPWQRGQQSGGSHTEHDAYRPGSVLADQPTIAEQRPSYAPQMPNGGGASVPNPFLTPKDAGGAPSPMPPGHHSIPLGGPGAIPVGGPSGPAGPAGGIAGRPIGARPTARPTGPVRGRPVRAPRKASLQLRRFDPWSVLKLSLVLSVAMFLMWLVAVGVLYGVLDGMGVWDKLNGAYSDLASVNDESGGAEPLISAGRVFGVSAVVGVVNIVLFTAFATVLAFVYNVSADLAGGVEVTLAERD